MKKSLTATWILLQILSLFDNPTYAGLVVEGSFETPALSVNAFSYNPGGSQWAFAGNSGLTHETSAFFGPSAPDGNQYAFLQSSSTDVSDFGTFSQQIVLGTSGTFTLSYLDAGRNVSTFGGNVTYDILLDSTIIVDDETTTTGQPFTLKTHPFVASAGSYTLSFKMDSAQPLGDNTAFFDQVSVVTEVPEPNAFLLVGSLFTAFGCTRRHYFWRDRTTLP